MQLLKDSTESQCSGKLSHYSFGDPRLPQRFWDKVEKRAGSLESECWIWIRCKNSGGYGSFSWRGRTRSAHVVSYDVLVGDISEGFERDHLCRDHACVNPGHLEAVTHRVNMLRGENPPAEQAKRVKCVQGHEFTPENTYHRGNRRVCRECGRAANRKSYWAHKARRVA